MSQFTVCLGLVVRVYLETPLGPQARRPEIVRQVAELVRVCPEGVVYLGRDLDESHAREHLEELNAELLASTATQVRSTEEDDGLGRVVDQVPVTLLRDDSLSGLDERLFRGMLKLRCRRIGGFKEFCNKQTDLFNY